MSAAVPARPEPPPAALALSAALAEHHAAATDLESAIARPFARLVEASAEALSRGGKLLFFGNGGSAADAQHLAAEFVVRFATERPALAALALTTDSSVLTASGNDHGFADVFARQVEALGRPGDVAIAFTTSGESENVLRGLEAARRGGLVAAALSGGTGGRLAGLADPLVLAPGVRTARIQEMHILIGHAFCDAIERALGYS